MTKEIYHLSPKALLGEPTHNELLRYMNTLKDAWELSPKQAIAVVLAPGGEGLVFCALQTSQE